MTTHDNGCFFSVTISKADIKSFREKWPCSGLLYHKPIWAQFDKRNGDLVDLKSNGSADNDALSALLQDAQNYAATKLNLPEVCFRR